MSTIEISERERQVLEEVLRSALGNLVEEIYKPEPTDFEAVRREREGLLSKLQTRVSAPAEMVTRR